MKILIPAHLFSDVIPNGLPVVTWNTVNFLAQKGVKVYVTSNRTELKNIKKEDLHPNIKLFTIGHCYRSLTFDKTCTLKNGFFSLLIILFYNIDYVYVLDPAAAGFFAKFKLKPVATRALRYYDYQDPKVGESLKYDRSRKRQEEGLPITRSFIQRVEDYIASLLLKFIKMDLYDKKIDLLFFLSQDSITPEVKAMTRTKLVPLNQGVDAQKFYAPTKEEVAKIKNGKFIFLFVGKVAKRKGVEYLIEAFNKLAPEAPDAEVWLVGAGAPDTVEFFQSLIKTDRIKILGRILTDEIPSYYQACDVFVLPSLDEAASNAVAEAFVCGKPVITTKVGQVLDYFKDGEFGLLVEPADSEGLYNAMKKVYQNKGLREKMAANTKKHGMENYTMDKVVETIIKGFEELKINNKPK